MKPIKKLSTRQTYSFNDYDQSKQNYPKQNAPSYTNQSLNDNKKQYSQGSSYAYNTPQTSTNSSNNCNGKDCCMATCACCQICLVCCQFIEMIVDLVLCCCR